MVVCGMIQQEGNLVLKVHQYELSSHHLIMNIIHEEGHYCSYIIKRDNNLIQRASDQFILYREYY